MNYKNYIKSIAVFLSLLVISLPFTFAEELNRVYDANGNLISDGRYYREYNGLNQLVRIRDGNTSASPVLEEYKWHPLEERTVIKRVFSNGVLNYTVYYPNQNYVYIVNSSGSYSEKYIYQDGILVAQVNTNGQKQAVHSDHEGSNTLITDSAGAVVENTFYSPYGEILAGGKSSRYGYEGKEFDSLVEKIDFKFRDYDPKIIIFGKPDDIIKNVYDPQSLNRYMFEKGNPQKNVDPTGHAIIAALLIIGVIMYASYVLSQAAEASYSDYKEYVPEYEQQRFVENWYKANTFLDLSAETLGLKETYLKWSIKPLKVIGELDIVSAPSNFIFTLYASPQAQGHYRGRMEQARTNAYGLIGVAIEKSTSGSGSLSLTNDQFRLDYLVQRWLKQNPEKKEELEKLVGSGRGNSGQISPGIETPCRLNCDKILKPKKLKK